MDQHIEVVLSQRNQPKILCNGFTYNFVENGKFKKIWQCEKRRKLKGNCMARLHTTEDLDSLEVLHLKGAHNHEPNAIRTDIQKFRHEVRKDAKSTSDAPAIVLARHLKNLSSAGKGCLPLMQNLKRNIRHARSTSNGSLPNPTARQEVDLPESYTTDTTGNNFLLVDTGAERDRILIFGTVANLKFLARCDMWMCDGTFKVSPVIFDQLFVIHGYRNTTSFPLLFCLTPNRLTGTYSRILGKLKEIEPTLQPINMMSDFERASINAFADAFQGVDQKGCFFHFRQAVYKNIQEYPEVNQQYANDGEFCLQMRHLVALAFVPPEDVVSLFEQLMEEPFYVANEEILNEFLQYFENTWIGPFNRRRTARLRPMYAIELWNCYHSVLGDLPKTNNHCEAFHRGFAANLGASHPTIYKLIDGLKNAQVETETKIQQFLNGTTPPPNREFLEIKQNLKNAVLQYATSERMEQLRRLAYCISKD